MTTIPEEAVKAAINAWFEETRPHVMNTTPLPEQACRMRLALTAALPFLIEWPKGYRFIPQQPTQTMLEVMAFNLSAEFGADFTRENQEFALAVYNEAWAFGIRPLPHLPQGVGVKGDDLVERVARAWASIHGKSDLFDECKASKAMEYQNGTYEGYMAEARELIKRAALEPSAASELALEEGDLQELLERLDAGLEYEGWMETDGAPVELFDIEAAQDLFADAAAAIRSLSSPDHADAGKVEGDGWLPMTHPDLPLNGASVVMFDSFILGKDGFGQVIARFDKTYGWHVSASVVGGKYIQLTNPIKWRPLPSAPSQEVAGS